MEYRRGLTLVIIGVLTLLLGGFLGKPSVPRASINDLATLMVVIGSILFIWGVVNLKKEKDKS